jgi:hypothetical protein
MLMKVAACILGSRRAPYRMIVISRLHWDGQKDASGERIPATSSITNTVYTARWSEGGYGSSDITVSIPRFQDRQNVLWEKQTGYSEPPSNSVLLTIMSNQRPSDHTRGHKMAGSYKGKLSSLLRLSRAPTPSSIDMDSRSDNRTT